LDLTTEGLSNLWNKYQKFVYIAIAVAVLGLVIIAFIKGYFSDDRNAKDVEAGLPTIKVRVINGCGYDRLATDFGDFIGKKNIEVVELGDTPKPIYDRTIIVVRKDDREDLLRLQKMTGIKRFTMALMESPKADFDIIVGKDYEEFMSK